LSSILCLFVLSSVTSSQAQITNGDFENGGTGWDTSVPANWSLTFYGSEGNPGGYVGIQSPFGDSGGEACVSQDFQCNSPDGCDIYVDYRHEWIDSNPLAGRILVKLGGGVIHTSAPVNDQPWTTIRMGPVIEGTHTIEICLEVDEGNNGWEAGIDNVACPGCQGIGVEAIGWGTVKARY
jgi:hypothetical protein